MDFKKTILLSLIVLWTTNINAQTKKSEEGKPVYCWMSGGSKVCGNTPPPEASMTEVERVSTRTGLILRQVLKFSDRQGSAAQSVQGSTTAQQNTRVAGVATPTPTLTQNNPSDSTKSQIALLEKNLKSYKTQQPVLAKKLMTILVSLADKELDGKQISEKERNDLLAVKKKVTHSKQFIAESNLKIKALKES